MTRYSYDRMVQELFYLKELEEAKKPCAKLFNILFGLCDITGLYVYIQLLPSSTEYIIADRSIGRFKVLYSLYGDIYRNISIGDNIDGVEAYRCVGVVLVGGN